jgi:glycosyltransferase involved in cell wall biosynthesis
MIGDSGHPMRIAFLIRALDVGGAERQLALLAEALVRRGHHVSVFVFYGGRAVEERLAAAGVGVHDLRKAGRWDFVSFGWRLVSSLRQVTPDILYSFLPSANVVASMARPFMRARVVWGIRAANMQSPSYDWLGHVVNRIEAAAARHVDGIIANSRAGYDHHVTRGYPAARMVVIHNGVEAGCFRFDPVARLRLRAVWGVGGSDVLTGIVGRLDPMKGHESFFAAAGLVLAKRPDARFVVVGAGTAGREAALRAALPPALAQRVVWARVHADMASVYSAMDVLCSASIYGEGWSNTLAEGLLCGCVCVASRVGDAATLIADSRRLFNPGDVVAMAGRISDAIDASGAVDRNAGRARIEELCGVDRLVAETEAFFRSVLEGRVQLSA